jgi:tetratricopeptide (TPR) repeat protein
MAGEKICDRCGAEYSGAICPECTAERISMTTSLPFAMFIIGLFLVIGFSATRLAVSSYRTREQQLAIDWQKRGEAALRDGHPEEAAERFENALVYDRENFTYRLELASALMQANRLDEAKSHLRTLWDEHPGDASVNLLLGRAEVLQGNAAAANRYFEGAIYGVWPKGVDPYRERTKARMELAELLIRQKRTGEAQAQLTALAAELPPNSEFHKTTGDLLMRAEAPRRAFLEYMAAREANRGKGMALELAQAAFAQNDFTLANKWGGMAIREDPTLPANREFGQKVAMVVESDPFNRGIGELERALRVIRAFEAADARMGACFPSYVAGPHSREIVQSEAGGQPKGNLTATQQNQVANFSEWAHQLRPRMIAAKLRHEDDVQENAMRFVFQGEQFATKNCELQPGARDAALLSLSKARWSSE